MFDQTLRGAKKQVEIVHGQSLLDETKASEMFGYRDRKRALKWIAA